MRTELELWKEVLRYADGHFKTGLCNLIADLCLLDCSPLPHEAYHVLINPLTDYYLNSGEISHHSGAYWLGPKGDIEPRIKWIEKRIKELEDGKG